MIDGPYNPLDKVKSHITQEIAIVLEKVFGLKAYIWVGLQSNWDKARRER
jgi:plasmid maintenance system antidote protein VapI